MASSNSASSIKTRFVCISDTHSRYEFSLPDGDILLHGGDFSLTGLESEVVKFLNWLKSLTKYRLKVVIAGNHDLTLQPDFYKIWWQRWHRAKEDTQSIQNMWNNPELKTKYGIIYLQDQEFIDEQTGFKFYGSPWQPEFHNWAFNLPHNSEQLEAVWSKIPLNTDILLTHGPPSNILDRTFTNESAGCEVLTKRLKLVKPKLHVFGHIHEAYGNCESNGTIYVNACTCNLRYKPVQPPIVIELENPNQIVSC